ncbi:NAD(P)H-dependent oxidoreductase [Salipaludibacillus daqingensis]|uniref:NAD(P)H-dependent oxidoreductase n=1 Tax=Salipaludibacillus daqingensis TaxID=3041001 RepID=UPI002473C928|nr:NAD(P)H-dependent oxidoreductase [Salipaludibacillus daqingensis]
MNVYIIYMHPVKDSFNGSILKELITSLTEKKHQVEVNHLYAGPFKSHLTWEEYRESLNHHYESDCEEEQEMIRWADQIIFIFPVWWGGFPAIGKGYIDRVLSYGFAYELNGESPIPLMKNKKVSMIFTTGAPEEEFIESGMYHHMVDLIDKSIFQFCGFKLDGVIHLGDVIQKSDEQRQDMLKIVKEFCDRKY